MQTLSFAWPNAGCQVPTGHSAHVLSELAPSLGLHVPRRQSLQLDCRDAPISLLQVPGEQAMHVAGDGAPRTWLHVPVGHFVQTSLLVAPVSDDQVPG